MTSQDRMTRPAADILVVDDEVGSRRLLTEILSREGYKVRPANGPRAALESALAYPPSLILLDVRMPDMDGFEVCRRLRADPILADVPVVMVTALDDRELVPLRGNPFLAVFSEFLADSELLALEPEMLEARRPADRRPVPWARGRAPRRARLPFKRPGR